MNWPFVLILIAFIGLACLAVGQVFAAFGLVLLAVEAVALLGWWLTKITHDTTNGGPPNGQGPNI